jgi:tRNA-splicing ligase RtcB (3'-phosphate/5'-hydroxy nucleic acid ligase)
MAKISGKELRKLGFPEGPVIGLIIDRVHQYYKKTSKHQVIEMLEKLLEDPLHFVGDEAFGKAAEALIPKAPAEDFTIPLNEKEAPWQIFGSDQIESAAIIQMRQATRIPVASSGALMADAHSGYGLPIGGVLATDNAVIPYGVGVDIGCRMCLSVFDIDPLELQTKQRFFSSQLNEHTLFGTGKEFKSTIDHPVLNRTEFRELKIARDMLDTAARQLGTSGSGNHFVEFGAVEIPADDYVSGLKAGRYLGLLSHSGSRGLGANIANHYTRRAKEKRQLPKDAANLAWFTLDEEEGIEYWKAMNLAGDYASACHHVIHEKIAMAVGRSPMRMIENHHNFAWKELVDGKEKIVHRKGATPAGKNVLGIIPGSMTASGFIVKGKGNQASLASASHGAGRRMSRTAAIKSITHKQMDSMLEAFGVKLIGGGLDESPQAYKDIESVMRSQHELVDIVGRFHPKIVRMD